MTLRFCDPLAADLIRVCGGTEDHFWLFVDLRTRRITRRQAAEQYGRSPAYYSRWMHRTEPKVVQVLVVHAARMGLDLDVEDDLKTFTGRCLVSTDNSDYGSLRCA